MHLTYSLCLKFFFIPKYFSLEYIYIHFVQFCHQLVNPEIQNTSANDLEGKE
jgi:hypothetical protein